MTTMHQKATKRAVEPCRVVVALGGNAIATDAGDLALVQDAMRLVADVIVDGFDLVLTHGNGLQVGRLLLTSESNALQTQTSRLDVVVAQTQAIIGYRMMTALEAELAARGESRRVATLLTRVSVDAADAAWQSPTKPIGAYVSAEEARVRSGPGRTYRRIDGRGWRRVVPSPEPTGVLDEESIRLLVSEGAIVIGAGGGGVPVIADGSIVRGVEAVVDKDLTSALLGRIVGASMLVIATDVDHVYIRFGTPGAQPLTNVTASELRELAARGEFSAGSMGPKVEAAARFVEDGGDRAVIASLEQLPAAVRGEAGTVVTSSREHEHARANNSPERLQIERCR